MNRDDKTSKPNSIRKDRHDGWAVYATLTYGSNSVLAGQQQEIPVDFFDTVEEAQAKYPSLPILLPIEGHAGALTAPTLPDSPPGWFDPTAAGESWHENDY